MARTTLLGGETMIYRVNNLDGGSTDNPLVNEIFREDEEG